MNNNNILQYLIVTLLSLLVAQHVLKLDVNKVLMDAFDNLKGLVLGKSNNNNDRSNLLDFMYSNPEAEQEVEYEVEHEVEHETEQEELQLPVNCLPESESNELPSFDDRQYNTNVCPPATPQDNSVDRICEEKQLLGHNDYFKSTVTEKCMMKGSYLGEVSPFDSGYSKYRSL